MVERWRDGPARGQRPRKSERVATADVQSAQLRRMEGAAVAARLQHVLPKHGSVKAVRRSGRRERRATAAQAPEDVRVLMLAVLLNKTATHNPTSTNLPLDDVSMSRR